MATNYDHYAAANQLADRLDLEGHNEWASKIRNAMAEGATGTEIFMRLRWQLTQLRDRQAWLSKTSREQLEELLTELEKSLA